jgi:hypothetical protein
MSKKYRRLKNNGLTELPIKDKTSYTHKNPDQYNGEILDNQSVKLKNTNNKRVYIESCVCP